MSLKDFDWKKTLATVAPTVATALGGPLAGVAVNVAAKALGMEPDEKALEAAVASGDSNVLLKLKQAEIEFEERLAELGIEKERIAADDRKSARDLAIAKGTEPQIILSAIYTVGYFWTMYALFGGDVQIADNIKDLATALIGIMSAAQIQIMNFWFGSSSGSKAKDPVKR